MMFSVFAPRNWHDEKTFGYLEVMSGICGFLCILPRESRNNIAKAPPCPFCRLGETTMLLGMSR